MGMDMFGGGMGFGFPMWGGGLSGLWNNNHRTCSKADDGCDCGNQKLYTKPTLNKDRADIAALADEKYKLGENTTAAEKVAFNKKFDEAIVTQKIESDDIDKFDKKSQTFKFDFFIS